MMTKKFKKKDIVLNEKAPKKSELDEMPFEKMDFDIAKKIISDYLGKEISAEEIKSESFEEEKFIILEIDNLQDGLKKASNILEIPIVKIRYKIIEKYFKEIDGKSKEFFQVEFREKAARGNSKIKISDDKLSAYFSLVYPEQPDGKETTFQVLVDLIKKQNIKFGIKFDEIEKIISQLKENYDVLSNILIAQGKSPFKGEDSVFEFSIFSNIDEINYVKNQKVGLDEIFLSSNLDFIKEKFYPVRIVEKGELIAITSLQKTGEKGIDVLGNEIEGVKGKLLFQGGKNVNVKIEDEKVKYYSETFGYLEFNDGSLAVHFPIWVSEDSMEAYFVKLPDASENIKNFKSDELIEQLKKINVKFGIKEDVIKMISDDLENGNYEFGLILIAEGVREKKGDNAKIGLFFEDERTPGKILKDGSIDYREINLVKTVKKNQLIAVKHFAKDGTTGMDLKGNTTNAEKGEDKKFIPVNNVKIELKENKALYYSTIEGCVTLVGDSGISVNQIYNVSGNVDFNTGNIGFNGSVDIKGFVGSGFKVKAEGDINIKGIVNQSAELIAGGNININQGVVGRGDTKLIAKGSVYAQYIQNSIVEAKGDVIVKDYIMNSVVKSGGSIITPDKGSKGKSKGLIIGGELIAKKSVMANSIGSEYTQNTKIVVGVDYESDQKFKDFQKSLDYCESQITKIKGILKLGFQDINTLLERVKKLPKDKQKPFLDGFKKLNEINLLKSKILEKRSELVKESDGLSKNAVITVYNILYPRVYIQIGEAKYQTESPISKAKVKLGKNRREVEFESF